jgi:hypothetical protein
MVKGGGETSVVVEKQHDGGTFFGIIRPPGFYLLLQIPEQPDLALAVGGADHSSDMRQLLERSQSPSSKVESVDVDLVRLIPLSQ